jgi:hypothetical protein
MPLTTPQAIITLALKTSGVLGVGQSALAEDSNDVFDVLNGMIGQWNTKRWLIYHLLDKYVTTTGAMSYTVGPGCDFNVPRVDRLEAAFFRQYVSGIPGQTYVDYPLDILQSREDYNQVALKQLTSWPNAIFFDSGNPTGTVYPVPIPLQNGTYELHITIKEHLPQFTSLIQSVNLPDEYTEALWTNLTMRVCGIYPGAVLTPIVEGLAKASIASIRVANTQIPRLGMPRAMVRPPLYNIFSGQTY